jgi:hypothetical protein
MLSSHQRKRSLKEMDVQGVKEEEGVGVSTLVAAARVWLLLSDQDESDILEHGYLGRG